VEGEAVAGTDRKRRRCGPRRRRRQPHEDRGDDAGERQDSGPPHTVLPCPEHGANRNTTGPFCQSFGEKVLHIARTVLHRSGSRAGKGAASTDRYTESRFDRSCTSLPRTRLAHSETRADQDMVAAMVTTPWGDAGELRTRKLRPGGGPRDGATESNQRE